MRTAALFFLLVTCSCAGSLPPAVAEALPKAGAKLEQTKKSFEDADRLYTAVCLPPILPQLGGPCRDLAGALDSAESVINETVAVYSVLNDLAKALQ